jgi:hypothetical protein
MHTGGADDDGKPPAAEPGVWAVVVHNASGQLDWNCPERPTMRGNVPLSLTDS